jgi:hypothetical protein
MRFVCLNRPCSWTAKNRLAARASMILLMVLAAPLRGSAENVRTDPFVFVQQYIRDIGATERLRAQAAKEVAEAGPDPWAAVIHGGTQLSFELHSEALMLNEMRLLPPTENVPAQFAQLLEQKAKLHEATVDLAEKMMSGPQPGVDYGKLAATAPKLRAMLDETDETLFEATPLVFATLTSQTPDGHGHANQLVVSKAARTMLIQNLEGEFGGLLQDKNQNYGVEAATVLLGYLQNNGFKSSDEPD